MSKDIVILNIAFAPLPVEVLAVIRGLNFHYRVSDEINFDEDGGSVPHMTAIMMPVETENLELLYQLVAAVVKRHSPIPVTFGEFYAHQIATEQLVAGVAVQKNFDLSGFHEHLVNSLRHLAVPFQNLRPDMLYQGLGGHEATQMSVQFAIDNGTQLFKDPGTWAPHITSHVGPKPTGYTIPFREFVVDTLSIFQLGVYGTCKELLKSFPLGGVLAPVKKT